MTNIQMFAKNKAFPWPIIEDGPTTEGIFLANIQTFANY